MFSALHKPLLAAGALLAVGASLPLLLWPAGGNQDLLYVICDGPCRVESLESRLGSTRRLLEGKTQVRDELLAGSLTLRDAANRFALLNALRYDGNDHLIRAFRVASEEEALCRNVLAWVEEKAWNRPELAAVLARLQGEYRQEFGHPPAPLPTPGTAP